MKKDDGFVVLDRKALDDHRLSWGAKGFYAFLLANVDDDGSVKENVLTDYFKKSNTDILSIDDEVDEVVRIIENLESAGYISGFEIHEE